MIKKLKLYNEVIIPILFQKAVALSEGKDLISYVIFANAVAGLSVTKMGAVLSMPYREEVEKFLKS